MLNLSDLKFVDKATICRLPGLAPRLKSLSLRGLPILDSGSFGAVCQLKNLQELEVSGCYNISQRGFAQGCVVAKI